MRKSDFTHSRRIIREFGPTALKIAPNKTLIEMLDGMIEGKPVSTSITKHEPLPPDGENLEDFDTGTRQYEDLVDVQQLHDEIISLQEAQQKAVSEAKSKADSAAFESRVAEEVAKRMTAQDNS